ncbi:hypothetical protein [Gluconobacter albidus]|nr:hypothetical protein [Gluconobacter albidus]
MRFIAMLRANRYDVDLSRNRDVWVIRRMVVDNVWRNGDLSVLAGV